MYGVKVLPYTYLRFHRYDDYFSEFTKYQQALRAVHGAPLIQGATYAKSNSFADSLSTYIPAFKGGELRPAPAPAPPFRSTPLSRSVS